MQNIEVSLLHLLLGDHGLPKCMIVLADVDVTRYKLYVFATYALPYKMQVTLLGKQHILEVVKVEINLLVAAVIQLLSWL